MDESPQTKTSNEYPDENRTKTRNENIGTIRRSQQTERTNSACFVFPTETNTGVRELPVGKVVSVFRKLKKYNTEAFTVIYNNAS